MGGPGVCTRNTTKLQDRAPAKDFFEVMDDFQKTGMSDMEAVDILKNM